MIETRLYSLIVTNAHFPPKTIIRDDVIFVKILRHRSVVKYLLNAIASRYRDHILHFFSVYNFVSLVVCNGVDLEFQLTGK